MTTHKLATYQSPFSRFSLTNQREERHMLIKSEKKKIVPCDPKLPKDQQDQWFGEGRTVTKKNKSKLYMHVPFPFLLLMYSQAGP